MAWAGVRDASLFGAMCVQSGSTDPESLGDPARKIGNEDCLTLNVWAPAPAREPLPVIVFFHGGNWIAGSAQMPVYDGSSLAARGVVVVTANYRLGALGYLAHDAFAAEDPSRTTGNYGLLDQIAVLRWVARNARAFRGDDLHGALELPPAVAAQGAEHVPGQALRVHPHDDRHVGPDVAEHERQVGPALDVGAVRDEPELAEPRRQPRRLP